MDTKRLEVLDLLQDEIIQVLSGLSQLIGGTSYIYDPRLTKTTIVIDTDSQYDFAYMPVSSRG